MHGGDNKYKILVGKPKRKRPIGGPWHRWEYNIKTDIRETGWKGVDWMYLAQDRDQWRAVVNTKMSGFHKRLVNY
jgi:hypothetical protein